MCTNTKEITVGIEHVGVVGLGRLGRSLTGQLAALGFNVYVYDPSPARVAAAVAKGGTAVALPADAAEPADVVILAVDDEQTAEEMLFDLGGIGETLRPGACVVDASPTTAAFRERASARLARYEITRIDLSRFVPTAAAA
jgi:3-hydroxyisobutyrate dehydrogenase